MRLTVMSCALAVVFASSASAEELKVYAAAGVKAPLLTLAAEYEKATGHTIRAVFDTAGATNKAFLADPQAALLITTQALINEGEKSGRLKDGVSYGLGDTVAGFAAPPGSPKPDISDAARLKAAQISEIVQANRAALVGPFPQEFDLSTTYSLWHGAGVSSAAREFAALITGPAGRAALADEGLRPPAAR